MNDLYWLAGLIEGEGSFGYYVGSPRVTVKMCDLDIVTRLAAHLKSNVRSDKLRPRCKQIYTVEANGHRAAGLMMTLYPLMGARRQERIRACLSEWRKAPAKNGNKIRCCKGHEFSETNTYVYPNGRRGCRECRAANVRLFHHRRRDVHEPQTKIA